MARTTGKGPAPKNTPLDTTAAPAATQPVPTAASYGFNDAYLNAHPDIKELVAKAIAGQWDNTKFLQEFEKTPTGQATTDAEAAFDVAIVGPQAEDLQKQINDQAEEFRVKAQQLGIELSDADAMDYAKATVRSKLNAQDAFNFFSSKVQTQVPQEQRTGEVASIVDSLQTLATSYGITLTPDFVQQKTQEAVRQGGNWQSYIQSQENIFREQSKLLYPTVADRLDQYTLQDMLDPYLNTASDYLGINTKNMNLSDPMWTAALNGQNGQPMSRDEWVTKLRTDPKYGYDKTIKARNEYMGLADQLLSAFGMA